MPLVSVQMKTHRSPSKELEGGGKVDTDMYFVIDQEVERTLLGKHVRVLELYAGMNARVRLSGGSDAACSVLATLGKGAASAGGDCAMDSASAPVSRAGEQVREPADPRGLKRLLSEQSEDDAPLEVKRAKQRLETLKILRDDILSSAAKGAWHSKTVTNQGTVEYLFKELLACLKEVTKPGANGPDPRVIANKFTTFVNDKVFMNNDCYAHLKHLQSSLSELLTLEGEDQQMTKLIVELGKVPINADTLPDLNVADVVSRTRFRNCTLYKGFIRQRAEWYLEQAKAGAGPARIAHLSKCQELGDLPEGLVLTCAVAQSLFDERFPLGARLQLLTDKTSSAKLALHWDPKGEIGIAGHMLMDHPSVSTLLDNFGTFVKVSQLFLEESIVPPNPVLQSALTYLKQITLLFTPNDERLMRLLRAAWCARFATEPGQGHQLLQPVQELSDSTNASSLFKATKDLLAELPKTASAPSWFTEWKDHMKKMKEEKEKEKIDRDEVKDPAAKRSDDKDHAAKQLETAQGAIAASPATVPTEAGKKEVADVADVEKAAAIVGGGGEDGRVGPPGERTEEPKLKVGDFGMSQATKYKDMYDRKRCEIIAVLTDKYKVIIKEGPAEGQTRKFPWCLVQPIQAVETDGASSTHVSPAGNGAPQGGRRGGGAWLTGCFGNSEDPSVLLQKDCNVFW